MKLRGEYKLRVTENFINEFSNEYNYIHFSLNNYEAVIKLRDQLKKQVYKILDHCEIYKVVAYDPIMKYPIYRFSVKNYCVFYTVVNNVMELRNFRYKKSLNEDLLLN